MAGLLICAARQRKKRYTLDVDEQIEEAKASLDRINAWINSCDSKAGIVLALVGVLLTIIFTNDGMAEMYNVLQNIMPPANFCTILYTIRMKERAIITRLILLR